MLNCEEIAVRLSKYVDSELMPNLDTKGKWIIGTYMTLALDKMPEWIHSLLSNPMLSALDIEDENGLLDVMPLLDALERNAQKYGRLIIQFPLLGTLSFSNDDVIKLREYMR